MNELRLAREELELARSIFSSLVEKEAYPEQVEEAREVLRSAINNAKRAYNIYGGFPQKYRDHLFEGDGR